MMGELFSPAKNEQKYAKVGILGFQGSGKTYTATLFAIGLLDIHFKLTGEKAKAAFFDTENGSDFVAPMFEHAGYELIVARSRAFVDLKRAFDMAKKSGAEVMIIDSLTHVWRDLVESYKKGKGRKKLQFQDWGEIKPVWWEYADIFTAFPMHVIVCGRAGYEYEYEEDEDGKKELIKTGTKMKAETEFGFEPSLVLEMRSIRREKNGKPGTGVIENVCTVLKDRAHKINGFEFIFPTFKDFGPHWDHLKMAGKYRSVDITRDSQVLFRTDGEGNWRKRQIEREALLEDIKGEFIRRGIGKGKEEMAFKHQVSHECFGTDNWVRIKEEVNSQDLKKGVELMKDAMDDLMNAFIRNPDGVDVKGIVQRHREQLAQQRKDDDLPFDDIKENQGEQQGEAQPAQEQIQQQDEQQGVDDEGQKNMWED